jgi:predicted nucleotidyltransferase
VVSIDEILLIEDGPLRTASLVAWFQGLFGAGESTPVLVGGAAVELYSQGEYTTGDLDFVGRVTAKARAELERAGFVRSGRHWVHEAGQVFLEIPGETLGVDEESVWVDILGYRVHLISLEDLLVDRLGAWEYWKSSVDAVNAYQLWSACHDRIDTERLRRRIAAEGWQQALAALERFVQGLQNRSPSPEELERWAVAGP